MLGLGDMNADQLASKLEETLPVIRSVSEQFKDPVSCSYKPSTLPLPHTLCSADLSNGTELVSLCAPQRVWVPFVIVDSEDHIKQLMNE